MLRAALFIADPPMATLLRSLSDGSNEFAIESIVELGKTGYATARTLNTARPDVILLEMTEVARDLPLAEAIHAQSSDVPLVGLVSGEVESALGRGHPDLASFVVWPFSLVELEQAISVAVHTFHGGTQENLVAFLPGKAGSGASTVVLNTARVIAQELRRRVVVMEGDLHSGVLSAMLHVEPRTSIRDALAEASRMDNLSWQRHINQASGVDFLLTDTAIKEPVPSWTHYFQLLRFAAPKYDLVMVDLPEVVNSATAEIVRRARAVYVVTTPDVASLKLTKQRCLELDRWGVDHRRIQVLLNRGHHNDIGPQEAALILDYPVAATFPNEYKAIRRATAENGSVDKRSELGKSYLAFSRVLTGVGVEKKAWGLFGKSSIAGSHLEA